jgi:hypothetical protein
MIECKCIYKVCVCKPVVNELPEDKRYQWWKDNDMGEDVNNWEEVPKEEIWEDGELNNKQMQEKIIHHVTHTGEWILIRRIKKWVE